MVLALLQIFSSNREGPISSVQDSIIPNSLKMAQAKMNVRAGPDTFVFHSPTTVHQRTRVFISELAVQSNLITMKQRRDQYKIIYHPIFIVAVDIKISPNKLVIWLVQKLQIQKCIILGFKQTINKVILNCLLVTFQFI